MKMSAKRTSYSDSRRSTAGNDASSDLRRPSSADLGPVIIDSSAKKPVRQNSKQMDLSQREADYKRLNEELEAKTASLFQETESMLRQQEQYLAAAADLESQGPGYYIDRTTPSGPARPDYFVDSRLDGDNDDDDDDVKDLGFSHTLDSLSLMDADSEDVFQPSSVSLVRPSSGPIASASSRPSSQTAITTSIVRPATSSGSVPSKLPPKQTRSTTAPGKVRNKSAHSSRLADDVALVEDPSMMRDINLDEAFQRIAHDVDDADIENGANDDDILPPPAQEMGHEAKVRFLKAKVRVLQEELEKLSAEKSKMENESVSRSAKMKSMEEERSRLQKSASAQQSAAAKQKQIVDDLKAKLTAAETQAATLKRQNDQLQRDLKTQQGNVGASEVRLNRALEEMEKLKSEVTKAKSSSKESQQEEKKRLDSLLAENRKLEKQKSDLIQGFRKQARLIDVLKRQKMHLEAAKMLQFTEEEFVKALEWGSG